jgi:hypothetical protein
VKEKKRPLSFIVDLLLHRKKPSPSYGCLVCVSVSPPSFYTSSSLLDICLTYRYGMIIFLLFLLLLLLLALALPSVLAVAKDITSGLVSCLFTCPFRENACLPS